jgi:hypothetical protein
MRTLLLGLATLALVLACGGGPSAPDPLDPDVDPLEVLGDEEDGEDADGADAGAGEGMPDVPADSAFAGPLGKLKPGMPFDGARQVFSPDFGPGFDNGAGRVYFEEVGAGCRILVLEDQAGTLGQVSVEETPEEPCPGPPM